MIDKPQKTGEYTHGVFWDFPDKVTGRTQRRHKFFMGVEGAREFVKRQIAMNPAIKATIQPLAANDLEQFNNANKEEADRKNRRRLVELMLQHNITLPARSFDKWRPTAEKTGRIDGVSDGLTCIMTDGLLAYFIREGREPLYGHVAWFKWDDPETSYVPYQKEDGSTGFFKVVRDTGAPSPYFRFEKVRHATDEPARRKKVEPKITTKSATAMVEKMLARYGIKA